MITLSFLSYCFSIKAEEPIEVTLLAIVTLVRLLQNSNAEEPIEVQPRHKRLSRQQLQVMLKKNKNFPLGSICITGLFEQYAYKFNPLILSGLRY